MYSHVSAITAAALLWTASASAHAVLERKQAPADSYYKAVILIAHGCEGSPTLRVRVRLPEGITSAKPQPKPGWEVAVRREKLKGPIKADHGRTITEIVAEVTWTGRLADDNFDEFAMQLRLPDRPGQTLYFPVVQECEKGVHRWIELPTAGGQELREPAPALT